jgi:predicted O-linked N-acetylglucosamine transferase (SPINDLY family)
MLTNMGFPELIVHNINDYVKAAVALANDKDKIIYYKNNIRQKFIELMDGKKFSNEFDQLMCETFLNHK